MLSHGATSSEARVQSEYKNPATSATSFSPFLLTRACTALYDLTAQRCAKATPVLVFSLILRDFKGLVAPSGIEPELFALRGRRVNQLHHGAAGWDRSLARPAFSNISGACRLSAPVLQASTASETARDLLHNR